VIDHFRRVPLFSLVSTKSLRAVIHAATDLDVKAGKVLVTEGDHDRDLFVITRGEATVARGRRKLSTLGPGDFFGEVALLCGGERSATVTAATDMRVMILAWREMRSLVGSDGALARRMLETMAKRVRQTERSLTH
jgi:CRP-like cAMP-binding protein